MRNTGLATQHGADTSQVFCLLVTVHVHHLVMLIADDSINKSAPEPQSKVESINNVEGIFPKGCEWRDIQHDEQTKKFWAKEQYEYWHGDVKPGECQPKLGKPTQCWVTACIGTSKVHGTLRCSPMF